MAECYLAKRKNDASQFSRIAWKDAEGYHLGAIEAMGDRIRSSEGTHGRSHPLVNETKRRNDVSIPRRASKGCAGLAPVSHVPERGFWNGQSLSQTKGR